VDRTLIALALGSAEVGVRAAQTLAMIRDAIASQGG
jgi:hypothetical protein